LPFLLRYPPHFLLHCQQPNNSRHHSPLPSPLRFRRYRLRCVMDRNLFHDIITRRQVAE
jgi:hypothetical protein